MFAFLGQRGASSDEQVNFYTAAVCLVASSGGLLFGIDVGITGGVLAMPSFLNKFFPDVYANLQNTSDDPYCTYSDQRLAFYTSSLFLAGIPASFCASIVSSRCGRKCSMVIAALLYILGAALDVGAINTVMLVFGRIFMGFATGFANQVVPLFLTEIPPPHFRGSLQILFQLTVNVGILIGGLVNLVTSQVEYGWRISLAIGIPPAIILLIGGIWLPETPNNLMERDRKEEARQVLQKLRGIDNVDDEFALIEKEAMLAKSQDLFSEWKLLFSKNYKGEATVACMVAIFSQLTGIVAINYYIPQLFSSLGSSEQASLVNGTVVEGVFLFGAVTSIILVDRVGRLPLLIWGGIVMALLQTTLTIVMRYEFADHSTAMSPSATKGTLSLICFFIYTFGTTWGPLGWLVPVECQSLSTRSAAQSASVMVNFAAVFVATQSFLPLLCSMEWGIFLLYSFFDVAMAVFAWILVPETKGVPIENMRQVWKSHPFWSRRIDPDNHVEDSNTGQPEETGLLQINPKD